MYEQIMLIGHLGRDVELNYTPAGKAVATFSLAVNPRKDSPPTWYRVTCWERLAEVVNEYLTKGSQVFLVGNNLKASAWLDNESGEARASLEITARDVKFLSGGQQSDEHAAAPEVGSDEKIPF